MALCSPLLLYFISNRRAKLPVEHKIAVAIILVTLSVVIGGRYQVGSDFPNYVEYYKSYLLGNSNFHDIFYMGNNLEPGYLFINWLGSKLGLSVSLFFTFIAFISFVLLLSSQKDRAYLWPLILLFFFGQMYGLSVNIVRQACAIFLFFYALRYVGKSKLCLFLLVTCCTLLHYSSVVFYVSLIIDTRWLKFLDNKKIVILAFVSTWLLASYILPLFMRIMPLSVFTMKYLQSFENLDVEMAVSSGLGILTTKFTDILLIFLSDGVIKYYKDDKLRFIFRLFFLGIIMANIMGISMYLSRIFLGMVMLRIYILAFTAYCCLKHRDYRFIFGVFLIILSVIQFIMAITNSDAGISPYQFLWQ